MEKNLEIIDELLTAFENSTFDEIEVEVDGIELHLRRSGVPVGPANVGVGTSGSETARAQEMPVNRASEQQAVAARDENTENYVAVEAPLDGTFYRAPSPTEPPFVTVGDVIEAGQTIGLVEVMKLFNSVSATVSGKVVKVVPDDGAPVQKGDPLLLVTPIR